MSLDRKWQPMKWPCGPLEVARRTKSGSMNSDAKEAIEAWGHASALELLKGTPVNCLVVPWAEGGPEDSAQRQALQPLLEAGRRLGMSFVAKIASEADAASAVAAARAAGFAAVMVENPSGQSFALPVIPQFPRDKVAWEKTSTIFSSSENVWPGLNLETMHGDTAVAGPTGIPWVNSNAWFALLAEELAPGRTLWLDFDPPAASTAAHPTGYALAVADSRAYGSRWIISLDDKLLAGLAKGNAQAKQVWQDLCATLAFFESHREWESLRALGALAVVSDFRGENAYLSGEVLNLLNRRQVQFRVIERTRSLPTLTPSLRAILWLDREAPSAEQRSRLLEFAQQGGLVIAADYWGPAGVAPTKKDPALPYTMYNAGKGQIAVAVEGFQDPYQVAVDTHLLLSRRNDLVRLYNPETTNCHCSGDFSSPHEGKRLVQVLNYSSDRAESVTVWLNARVVSARLWRPEAKDARTLEGVAASPGTDFDLPPLSVYCALEYEGTRL